MIRKLEAAEITQVYEEHIKVDFELERPPLEELIRLADTDCIQVLMLVKDGAERGYGICLERDSYMVLLFFAAYRDYRGQGIGTGFIQELQEYYNHKEIIVEVETLDNSEEEEEQILIKRRISFYENLGFSMLPDIKEWLNGHVYHIMILPGDKDSTTKEDILNIMESIYKGNLYSVIQNFEIRNVKQNP